MKKYYLLPLIVLFCYTNLWAQDSIKKINAIRINTPPKIDAVLDDDCWKNVPPAKDFTQLRPNNGKRASYPTEVKIVYDDKAIYIAAMLYDNHSDSIMKQYTPRDGYGSSDMFGLFIDPFNNGINTFGFLVTPVNVQVDVKGQENGPEDTNWDAVWKSKTQIVDNGWIVEYKIPYSALRFPKKNIQKWGLNIIRTIERFREKSTWSFIDLTKQGWITQQGELNGIENISPPLRLSFTPYVSAYVENNEESSSWTNFYRGGLDLKYGINESYTLDMMLVPDFGQIQSDDVELNLSPFEVFYDEKRQFFTEGTELFERADIFYSRRIGRTPNNFWEMEDELGENEEITKNPSVTQLINATKVSGRSPKGLAVGFLNGMTLNTYATIKNTETNIERKEITQPFTNYNVLVFDKNLKNNSYASIINTNLSRFEDKYYANVTGTELSLYNKKKTYQLFAKGAVSQIWDNSSKPELGFYSQFVFSKSSGQFRFSVRNRIENDKFNPNDMGFLRNNNEINSSANFSYNIYKPFWRLLSMYNHLSIGYSQLYKQKKYTDSYISFNSNMTFKNHFSWGFYIGLAPYEFHDYFEARVDGRLYIEPASQRVYTWASTDYRKKLALNIELGTKLPNNYDSKGFTIELEPRYRPNDRLLFTISTEFDNNISDIGYVDMTDDEETIYFGRRDRISIENTINSRYIFNENMSANLRLRHYWSTVKYNKFYTLNTDGTLSDENDYNEANDINFNYFTIDLSFRWIFAPGSELSLVWKNSIFSDSDEIVDSYLDNLQKTLDSPQTNSISLRVLYYLDYMYFKGISKRN
ncbi:MAG: hypothetical protein B6I20_01325 [Bacteroidetes bacterium 4572_117]|nr:MAG: hypothetical protein B6I20_01325 [Bacteroidetes bacterium 4572_117]